ncbi:hypothetical protein MTR67_039605 [Solanum verrucosum]|uniref:Tf2-1-like SH3-like domain-containing protein n=1 Tax=Solanum verrucosum TaxID=315347 RepID=A0AAF0ZQV3_SOLVR|nr:hypothetical protein MTR67_039605 [Solanum verrucosum]
MHDELLDYLGESPSGLWRALATTLFGVGDTEGYVIAHMVSMSVKATALNNNELRDLEFEVDDCVNLKVSPTKVMKFGKKGKLSPRYIDPYRISKRIGNVAYKLELPLELGGVHPVFHIYMFKKCMGDPSLIISTENIGIKDSLSYEEIYRQVRKLKNNEVASVKVLWRN